MRRALAILVPLALLAGCVDAGIDAIEDARERRHAREGGAQESREPSPPIPRPTPSPSPSPSASAWPREGSVVRVEVWEASGARSWANWSHREGAWSGRCESTDGTRRAYTDEDPPHWPLTDRRDDLRVGDDVRAWYLDECRIRSVEATYDGMVDGAHRAHAPGFTTRWDARTGLVLEWERGASYGRLASRG